MAVRVNVREFRARLSAYLRRVKAGEVVEIAERGKPVGRVIPAQTPLPERMEMLAGMGLLLLGRGKLRPRKPAARVRGKKTVAELLVEERG